MLEHRVFSICGVDGCRLERVDVDAFDCFSDPVSPIRLSKPLV